MKKHLMNWLKALSLLLLCQGSLLPVPSAVAAASPHPADVCELPAPDAAWIIGATTSSITLGWTSVSGAHTYKVEVTNLDGGSAPSPQYITSPTTVATFSGLTPGQYMFGISTTGCLGGDFGQDIEVQGGTAIIIDEIIVESCAPTIIIAPLQTTTPVCIPYGDDASEETELIAYEIRGTYIPPIGPKGQVEWVCEFNVMMPCQGSFALSTPVLTNSTVQVFGGPNSPVGPMVKFHPAGYANIDLITISQLRWWSTPPNPDQNNGCNDEYVASFVIEVFINPMAGINVTSMKRSGTNHGHESFCMGQLANPGGFACQLTDPITRPANPGSGSVPGEVVPFDWEGQAAELRVAPNPFRQQLEVGYRLDQDTPLELALYSPTGRRVKTLEQTDLALAGTYRTALDAAELPVGLYYLVLQTDQERRIVPVIKTE